jgi:DNA-binding response OmpR family regulator
MPKHKVLIVEDEPDIAGLIKHTLERGGTADAEIVDSGDAALKSVTTDPPDLIILDLNLPVVSGMDVCRILRSRADARHLPIIMVTAKSGESDRVAGLDMGATTSPSPSAFENSRLACGQSSAGARRSGIVPRPSTRALI